MTDFVLTFPSAKELNSGSRDNSILFSYEPSQPFWIEAVIIKINDKDMPSNRMQPSKTSLSFSYEKESHALKIA